MANENEKDFNAMLHDNKDMPKFQTITDQKMYFAPPIDYDNANSLPSFFVWLIACVEILVVRPAKGN